MNSLIVEQRLSDWIESFRKDVECVFGVLKGRFRILKTGICLEGPVACDRVWMTCCALHNWLLEVDGMDEEWESDMGRNNASECRRFAPFAIRRLNDNQLEQFGSRQHEQESCEHIRMARERGEDYIAEDDDLIANLRRDAEGRVCVNSLSHTDFRHRLVIHFDILHRHNKIKWPERKRRNPRNNSSS